MAAIASNDSINDLLLTFGVVLSLRCLFDCLICALSFLAVRTASSNDFNWIGITCLTESSSTVASCLRLSISGLARDALTGVP